jgi:hypothetical protein
MALEGGDVRQVEVQAPNLPAALATGQADAAALIHSQAWRALQTGEFVNICETGVILNEIHGRHAEDIASDLVNFSIKFAGCQSVARRLSARLRQRRGTAPPPRRRH